NEPIVGVSSPNTLRPGNVTDRKALAGDFHDHASELVDRHHLLGPDIYGPREIRSHEPQCSLDALVNVQEGTGLLAIAPNLDFSPIRSFCHFAADSCRCLFPAAGPSPFRPEYVVVPCDTNLHTVVSMVRQIEPLAKQLFPSVFAVRSCGIRRVLRALRV